MALSLPSQIFHEMMEKEQVRRPSEPNGLLEAVRVTERGEEGRTPSSFHSSLFSYSPFSFPFSSSSLSSPPLPSLLLLSHLFSSSHFPFSSSPLPLPLLLSPLPPSVVTQAQNHPTVKEQIRSHIPVLQDFILQILQRLRDTIQDVPYGIRWLCKAIRALVQEKFPDVTVERMNSLIGGFFLLRYLNPIIVTPHSKSVCPFLG